ncbi:MAG: RyR domain-containing protein [Gammaproteobacteria bacterium]|nr:RyR domain-containing protein [Gammaproteobacteria bacterium]
MKLKHFVKINTKEMNKESRALFYSVVADMLPDIIAVIKTTNDDGEPTKTKMFHKVLDGEHWYIIPLKECPTEHQMDDLANKLSKTLHMGNFILESSLIENKDLFDNYVSNDDYSSLAEQFAKVLHEDWLNERRQNGWRYGEMRNDEDKTHPLIKEWSQLDESERDIKPKVIKDLIKVLQDNGFKITKK